MNHSRNTRKWTIYASRLTPVAGLLILLFALSGCGGLAGEPKIVATLPPPTAAPTSFPQQSPDLALGAQVFAARCTTCHGAGGRGDGDLVVSKKVSPPPDFTNLSTTASITPFEWFSIITNGRLDRLMPPWGDTLSEQQRWSVALYTYTLSYTADQIKQGQQIYQAQCASCHGDAGHGDGPQAAQVGAPVGDLTQQSKMVFLSDQSIQQVIAQGSGKMPAFSDKLDTPSQQAVVAYLRSLSLTNATTLGQQPAPATTPEVAQAATPQPGQATPTEAVPATTQEAVPATTPDLTSAKGQVTGHVVNGTAGSPVPADLKVTLRIHENGNIEPYDTTVKSDGSFTFDNIPIRPQSNYFASTIYQDRQFFSDVTTWDQTKTTLDLPLKIYEVTEDPKVVTINQIITQITPSQNDSGTAGLQITQLFVYSNSSDRMFSTSKKVADQTYASLLIPLPAGAQILGVDDPQRYIPAQQEDAIIDTAPVLPGDSNVSQVTYFIPYTNGLTIDQPLNNAFNGNLKVAVYPDSLSVSGASLSFTSKQAGQSQTYSIYDSTLTMNAGDKLNFSINGSLSGSGSSAITFPTNSILSVILLAVGAGLVLLGGVLYIRERQKSTVDRKRQMDQLVKQIAELDEAYEAKEIAEKVYERQRNQLKARLAELMGEKKA